MESTHEAPDLYRVTEDITLGPFTHSSIVGSGPSFDYDANDKNYIQEF